MFLVAQANEHEMGNTVRDFKLVVIRYLHCDEENSDMINFWSCFSVFVLYDQHSKPVFLTGLPGQA